jgi:TonB-dependent receptor
MRHLYKRSAGLLLGTVLVTQVAVAQTGKLKGVIVHQNERLTGVTVAIPALKKGVTTDAKGVFEIADVDTGRYEIELRYVGFITEKRWIQVGNHKTADLGTVELKKTGTALKEVVVNGGFKEGSASKAINMTKASNKVVTVVSSETIAKMPDKNAADAMQRVAGASVEKSKGEGNIVSLRGTPTDWTATLINGNRLPTANEGDASRIFDFSLFPSRLIDYIMVTRTITPDMEGDNIGGAINFLTRSAMKERTLELDVATGYSALARKPAAEVNFLYGDATKNQKFSFVVDGSYYTRVYAADAPVIAYGTNFNHSLARLELKKYTGQRQTFGINLAAEYRPSETFKIGTKLIHGRLTDDKWQQKTMYNWSDGSGARIRLQNIHGVLESRLYGGELNSEWKPSEKLTVTASAASYYNRFEYGNYPYGKGDNRNGYYTVEYISPLLEFTDKINTNFYGQAYDPNNAKDPNPYPYKFLDIDNPYHNGGDHYNNIQPKYQQLGMPGVGVNASEYYLSGAFADQNTSWESDPLILQLNGKYAVNSKITITAGAKYRMKEGERKLGYYEWRLVPGVSKISLDNFQTMNMDPHNDYLKEWDSPYTGTFMPFLTRDQMRSFPTQYADSLNGIPMDTSNNNYQDWVGAQYKYRENVTAGYIMADAKLGEKVQLTGGLRLEHTYLHETSDTLVDDPYSTIGVKAEERLTTRNYIALLPALNMQYMPGRNDKIRAAVSRTFHRPNFQETKPGAPIWQRENFIRIYGNPNLKPSYSLNLDLMYEHYWGTKGMWSIGGYYKDVTDHIFVSSEADDNPFNAGVMNKTFLNADQSFVAGVEAAIERKFDFLPGILSGFGVNANLTWSYSEMQVPGRPQKQAMSEQAPLLYNVALFYEYNKLTSRLGLNYRGAYISDINLAANPDPAAGGKPLHLDTDYDLFMGEMYSLDFQVSYAFSKHLSAYVELNNLTDAPYRTYVGRPERPLRTEYYRQKGMLGVKFKL